MPGPTSLRWRTFRAATFAFVATGLAALGHLIGGGTSPDLAVLVIGGAGSGAVVVGLARKRRGPVGIFLAMSACQLGFHLLFGTTTHAMATPAVATGLPTSAAEPLRMLAFHLVAAALSSLVLATGERAVFGLFAALARSVRVPPPPAVVDLPPRWTARFQPFDAPRPEGPLLSTSPRRGPPSDDRRPSGLAFR